MNNELIFFLSRFNHPTLSYLTHSCSQRWRTFFEGSSVTQEFTSGETSY